MATKPEPPDKGSGKFYKCHPKIKVSTVVCLICENVYHTAHFNKLERKIYISDVLGICSEHEELNLTSKTSEKFLSEDAKKIIAQIKKQEKDKVHKELQNNISLNASNFLGSSHNETIVGEDEDIESIKREYLLLKQLNTELVEKNLLLKEQIELMKLSAGNTKTYSDALKKDPAEITYVPSILIKPKNKDQNEKIFEDVINSIHKETVIPISKVNSTKNGCVIVKCKNKEDITRTEELLKNKIHIDCEVSTEKPKKPRLKLVRIENQMDNEELENDINDRNFLEFNSNCSVVHTYTHPKHNYRSAIIEVTSELYNKVKMNDNYVYVGHQRCRAFDDLNVALCYRCGRTGYTSKKCENNIACLICAGNHETKECTNKTKFKCVNCTYAHDILKLKRNLNHVATDTKCEYIKLKINKQIAQTEYSCKPEIPAFLGTIDFYNIKQKQRNGRTKPR